MEEATKVDEVQDNTKEIIPDTDDKTATAGDELAAPAGDQDDPKYQAALKAQETMNEFLEEKGFDSMEDLAEELESGKSLKEILGGRNAAKVIELADEMTFTKEYWAKQEEAKTRDEETESETTKRMEDRALKAEKSEKALRAEIAEAEENDKALSEFDSIIKGFIKAEDIPEEFRSVFEEFMGAGNPFNVLDIKNKGDVLKFAKAMSKKLQAHEQAVIKRYRKGKTDTPDITKTGAAPAEGPKKWKDGEEGIEERRKTAIAQLKAHFKTK